MSDLTRRDLIKRGAAAAAVGALPMLPAISRLAASADAATLPAGPGRERLLMDFGWRFALGHASDATKDFGYGRGDSYAKSNNFFQASRANFNDSSWRAVDLPHDWAVELPFVDAPRVNEHGAKPIGREYPETSIGWYRRVFQMPSTDLGRRISIEFDGVFRDSIVALNGHYIGRHLSGYSPFAFDVTDFVNYGGNNVLVVRADATESEGWFYEGTGIYRHVWLVKTDPLHVARYGTYVRSAVRRTFAELTIGTEVVNERDEAAACRVVSVLNDPAGKELVRVPSETFTIAPGTVHEVEQTAPMSLPQLWSLESPSMYRLVTIIERDGQEIDRYETPFGIRSIRMDADRGFFLNDTRVEVKGTCNHQDHAGVGSALPDRVQYFRISRLKDMGSNAYRTSHNHPTAELLDACDTLGMLVLDETRTMSATPDALADFETLVRRDRNHPSVMWWSIGNEEGDQGTELGARIARSMKAVARRLDPTREITEAMNGSWGNGLSAVVDIQGFNYGNAERIDAFHAKFPKQPSFGSETASTLCTRGEYAEDPTKGYMSAYDRRGPQWGSTAEVWWKWYAARPFLAGGFVWTGFDYRGEPTPYQWPCISSHFGIMDTCGFPKDNFYYYKSWWGDQPVLHLFPHWNWSGMEGKPIEVWVHSNLDRVELFLNGQSLGAKDVTPLTHVEWMVPYAPGTIEARGYRGGKVVLTATRETTNAPAAIRLTPDRARIAADREDVSMVTVEVVDDRGRVVPTANNAIAFAVSGPGRIIGVGNGDPSCHEADKAESRSVFNGLAQVIVQSTDRSGEIRLSASSGGLSGASALITSAPASLRPAVG